MIKQTCVFILCIQYGSIAHHVGKSSSVIRDVKFSFGHQQGDDELVLLLLTTEQTVIQEQ